MSIVQSPTHKKIIFGTGKFAESVLAAIDIGEVFSFLDNSEEKIGKDFYGKPVYSLEYITRIVDIKNYDLYIASMYYEEISQQLIRAGLTEGLHFKDASELLPVEQIRKNFNLAIDIEDEFVKIFIKVRRYTMTSVERMYALYQSVKYIVLNKIPGSFVECGVWRGGSAMLIAYTLIELGETNRDIYLYDTYEGFINTEFSTDDIDYKGNTVEEEIQFYEENNIDLWCHASINDVKQNLQQTCYPSAHIEYIIGRVEETLPTLVPDKISLLRLDTDLYYSTYKELEYLYPLIEKNGVLIVDDYGHWQGAKKAVTEYFKENKINMLLNKIDYTGRLGIKI